MIQLGKKYYPNISCRSFILIFHIFDNGPKMNGRLTRLVANWPELIPRLKPVTRRRKIWTSMLYDTNKSQKKNLIFFFPNLHTVLYKLFIPLQSLYLTERNYYFWTYYRRKRSTNTQILLLRYEHKISRNAKPPKMPCKIYYNTFLSFVSMKRESPLFGKQ
jgi:hypothetical protein